MARLGRAHPIRPHLARPVVRRDAIIRPATIHVATRFHPPGIIAVTPNAIIRPATIHVATRFHAPLVRRSAVIHPATIHVATRFYPPVIPRLPGAQLLEESQLEFGGFLMGAGTVYQWRILNGVDETPGITSGNVQRPAGDGSLRGSKTAEERVITFEMQIAAEVSLADLPSVLDRLRAATPIDAGERPLAIRQHGRIWLTSGEVIARPIPPVEHRLLKNFRPMVQWVCTDPLLYSDQLHVEYISPGGAAVALNVGNKPTRPKVIFQGPATNPVLTHLQTGRRLAYNLDIPDGEFVIADCHAGTVLLNGVVDVLPGRAFGSIPPRRFTLPAGAANLSYATSAGAGQVAVLWRDAVL